MESRYYHINPYEGDDYNYGLLLGGGTSVAPSGQSQLNTNGDRLVVALRMYRAGKFKKIICSGTSSFEDDLIKGPGETAVEILQNLGVPESDLVLLPGANTSQEMANLKRWVMQKSDAGIEVGRVALVSSAWHLPRVKRLTRGLELDIAPVPANFLSAPIAATPHVVVPGVSQIFITSQILKELLAGIVGR